MNLHLKNPLVCFDLETTGINVTRDRIVEFSMVKLMPNGERIIKTKKINPTIPIPLETSKIHGIYDGVIAGAPTFKSVANRLGRY